MLLVLGSLVVFTILLLAFGLLLGCMTRRLVLRMVERRHRELEELVTHGRMPLSWMGETPRCSLGAATARWRRRRRLDALTLDVRRSTLVADEETRRILLDRLAVVRARL